ncbi:hypothetical protein RFI_09165 [Reticulomyxa filosa]|uniref:RRM domain-containing protein n=1 Tax=Reticulomyxa filosa TaxID=46433 RepID=X6NPP2_RETFI|nr:hypothetical protein RFI_09165 [Reticulomyxa filosa]|eukprot:ETO27971.1 hypothetical protein RFI_09165 [Reticulomyxa filosa]
MSSYLRNLKYEHLCSNIIKLKDLSKFFDFSKEQLFVLKLFLKEKNGMKNLTFFEGRKRDEEAYENVDTEAPTNRRQQSRGGNPNRNSNRRTSDNDFSGYVRTQHSREKSQFNDNDFCCHWATDDDKIQIKTRVCIRNVSFNATHNEINDFLNAQFDEMAIRSKIKGTNLISGPDGKFKGLVFVDCQDEQIAQQLVNNLNKKLYFNRPLYVDFAHEKPKFKVLKYSIYLMKECIEKDLLIYYKGYFALDENSYKKNVLTIAEQSKLIASFRIHGIQKSKQKQRSKGISAELICNIFSKTKSLCPVFCILRFVIFVCYMSSTFTHKIYFHNIVFFTYIEYIQVLHQIF